jgi:tryptophan synthase alpha chain
MSVIAAVFQNKRHKALVPYITAGYPSAAATLEAVPILAENGADIIELGIPFSDPLADGATIQKASFGALQNGATPEGCLEMAGRLSARTQTPLVFMTYYNLLYRYGLDKFCLDCAARGVRGLIIPDLPVDEGGELEAAAQRAGLDLIYLLAPTSPEARIRAVARHGRGFIYLVSVAGVTGARRELPPGLPDFVARVRSHTRLPLCVGFGIATPEQAREVAGFADGIIVGSRLVQIMESGTGWQERLGELIRKMRGALDGEIEARL